MLIDSNIIIYSHEEEYKYLRKLLMRKDCNISEISRVEVLGYHLLTENQKDYFSVIFKYSSIIIPSKPIFDKAIEIRQKHNLKLGDSIIAATAVVNNLTLHTRNLNDFKRVKKLKCFNPIGK
ncbi:type II toxin-antitoxin system VapC family toxin [Sphingobacterium humi]|uniref:PIN domain-containing protein n=1 Tax=Sphingobacterium humi TaxID=1796905 RepID=A0A6N8KYD1_9SPHI|nr:type II toxin-antitoxin system VapC family toxin [Sphingobacterium humi]MVZ62483.1 PIN domain-containing protein [Sphingobacterium humi]